jgi:hypothetical protein
MEAPAQDCSFAHPFDFDKSAIVAGESARS